MPVLDRAVLPIQMHQPGLIPFLQRRLCDQLLGQIKIEIGFFHAM
jgi:hypothetical protein